MCPINTDFDDTLHGGSQSGVGFVLELGIVPITAYDNKFEYRIIQVYVTIYN